MKRIILALAVLLLAVPVVADYDGYDFFEEGEVLLDPEGWTDLICFELPCYATWHIEANVNVHSTDAELFEDPVQCKAKLTGPGGRLHDKNVTSYLPTEPTMGFSGRVGTMLVIEARENLFAGDLVCLEVTLSWSPEEAATFGRYQIEGEVKGHCQDE